MAQLLVLVVLADYLFYHHPLGWTVAAYAALLAIGILHRRPDALTHRSVRWVLAGTLGMITALALEPDALALCMAAVALVTLAATTRQGWRWEASVWLRRWSEFVLLGPAAMFLDAQRWRRVHHTRSRRNGLWEWLVPGTLTATFVALFSVANPIFEEFFTSRWLQVWNALVDLVSGAALDRVALWLLTAFGVWGLLRHRFRDRRAGHATRECAGPRWLQTRFVIRCLLLFNAVFLMENVLDARYLWGGMELPSGITFASYAHRGAYPLVATALLAAAFVLFAFRPQGISERSRLARWLVHIWLGQNLFLTLSALWRLDLYIGVYSMTRWRLAAGIWMLLVLFGLATILWRIVSRRDNHWLLGANTVSTLLLLCALTFPDLDERIARFNVERCRESGGAGVELDIDYLIELGPSSLPALDWLERNLASPEILREISTARRQLQLGLATRLNDWRGWTLQLHSLTSR